MNQQKKRSVEAKMLEELRTLYPFIAQHLSLNPMPYIWNKIGNAIPHIKTRIKTWARKT